MHTDVARTLIPGPDVSTVADDVPRFRASRHGAEHPDPQLVRGEAVDLSGPWSMRFDPDDVGDGEGWQHSNGFERTILVPFPPESPASGIGDTGYHAVLWYHRDIDEETLGARRPHDRLMLHFGAVDYRASVWLNGVFLGRHEGGHTPFRLDATDALTEGPQRLVVRAEDDPLDVAQPRGKQDWQESPHSVWYHRTTGIWQPVWLEWVPELSVTELRWSPDVPNGTVGLSVGLSNRPTTPQRLSVDLWFDEERLASWSLIVTESRTEVAIAIPRQRNGQDYEQLLWSPEHPRLIDAVVSVRPADDAGPGGVGGPGDVVHSYFGLRSAAVADGAFLLNDRPVYLRSVLSQGFWPESHLAAPSPQALRDEVEIIKALGFNAARVHQKIEDPRFLYWADRLGLLLWAEMPSAYEFSETAVRRVVAEWTDVIRRDSSHPSIVTWVPLNESWGVQHIAHSPAVQHYAASLVHLTKALDPSRPVVSNDGWEHLDSDIWSVHDYEARGEVLEQRYRDEAAADRLLAGIGPAGRRMRLTHEPRRGQPMMLTEFGGVKYTPGEAGDDGWGYSTASSEDDFAHRLGSLFDAVSSSTVLAGFCYTQLTDTGQEVNGLLTADRRPKLPIGRLRGIVESEQTLGSAE